MVESKPDADKALPKPKQTTVEGKPKTRGYLYRFDRWGQDYWRVMHAVTFLYPESPSEEDKYQMLTFLRLIPFLLPCSACGFHFAQLIQDETTGLSNEVLNSRDSLSRWLVEAHNEVNRRLGKPIVNYERVRHFYTKDADCPLRTSDIKSDPTQPYKIAVAILSVMLICVIVGSLIMMTRVAAGAASVILDNKQRQPRPRAWT